MNDQQDRERVAWTTRINLRPTSRDLIRSIARGECISVATMIGMAIETYVTARSTS